MLLDEEERTALLDERVALLDERLTVPDERIGVLDVRLIVPDDLTEVLDERIGVVVVVVVRVPLSTAEARLVVERLGVAICSLERVALERVVVTEVRLTVLREAEETPVRELVVLVRVAVASPRRILELPYVALRVL